MTKKSLFVFVGLAMFAQTTFAAGLFDSIPTASFSNTPGLSVISGDNSKTPAENLAACQTELAAAEAKLSANGFTILQVIACKSAGPVSGGAFYAYGGVTFIK